MHSPTGYTAGAFGWWPFGQQLMWVIGVALLGFLALLVVREMFKGQPAAVQVREPITDVVDSDHEIVFTAELPGADEESIQVTVLDDLVSVVTGGERRYCGVTQLPVAVEPIPTQRDYRNGLLRLRLQKT